MQVREVCCQGLLPMMQIAYNHRWLSQKVALEDRAMAGNPAHTSIFSRCNALRSRAGQTDIEVFVPDTAGKAPCLCSIYAGGDG